MKRTRRSYVDPNKQRWHRVAQLVSFDRLVDKPVRLRRAVYLDTREALQTIAMLRHGYAPENMLAINDEAVELALLTQRLDRLGLPRVCTKTGEFSEACQGLGEVDVLDFDGMSHCGGEIGDVMLTNAAYATTPTVLSFTVLCGRENERGREAIKAIAEHHADRLTPSHDSSGRKVTNSNHWSRLKAVAINACAAHGTCLFHVKEFLWGHYRSTSGQPMAWMALKLVPHKLDRMARLDDALRALTKWNSLSPGGRSAVARECLIAGSEYIKASTRNSRACSYGLMPSCVASALFMNGDDDEDEAPNVVCVDNIGFSGWSPEQVAKLGFNLSCCRGYRGWPSRNDIRG